MTDDRDDRDPRCPGCGDTNPERCECGTSDDDDDPGPHAYIYVGVDDHDECDICGRRPDQFARLPEHMQPDWDGAA